MFIKINNQFSRRSNLAVEVADIEKWSVCSPILCFKKTYKSLRFNESFHQIKMLLWKKVSEKRKVLPKSIIKMFQCAYFYRLNYFEPFSWIYSKVFFFEKTYTSSFWTYFDLPLHVNLKFIYFHSDVFETSIRGNRFILTKT